MKIRSTLAILAIAAVVLAGGCGNPVRDKIESGVADSLMQALGPAESYSVRVYGPTLRLVNGKLDAIDITGKGVQLPSGLTVSHLFVRIDDLSVDPSTRQIRSAGKSRFEATLSEAELNRYVRKTYPAIPDLRLQLKKDYLTLSARPGIGGVRASIEADAGLEVRQSRILALDLRDVRAVGISAPGVARNFIDQRLPVVFDARAMGFDATINTAKVQPGGVSIAGGLDLMSAVSNKAP